MFCFSSTWTQIDNLLARCPLKTQKPPKSHPMKGRRLLKIFKKSVLFVLALKTGQSSLEFRLFETRISGNQDLPFIFFEKFNPTNHPIKAFFVTASLSPNQNKLI